MAGHCGAKGEFPLIGVFQAPSVEGLHQQSLAACTYATFILSNTKTKLLKVLPGKPFARRGLGRS